MTKLDDELNSLWIVYMKCVYEVCYDNQICYEYCKLNYEDAKIDGEFTGTWVCLHVVTNDLQIVFAIIIEKKAVWIFIIKINLYMSSTAING